MPSGHPAAGSADLPWGTVRILAAVILSAAFLFRLYLTRYHTVMAPDYDGYQYIMIARGMLNGTLSDQAVNWTPLFPAFIALFSFLPVPQDLTGSFVNIAAGSLSSVIIFLIGREIASVRAGFLAAVMVSFNPVTAYADVTVMSETTYFLFCLMLALYALRLTRRHVKFPAAAAFGICGAACYYGRPEGLLLFSALVMYILLYSSITPARDRFFFAGVACLFFLVTILPYLFFLRQQTGAFALSGKSQATLQTLRGVLNATQDESSLLALYLRAPLRTLGHVGENIAAFGTLLHRFTGYLYIFAAAFPVLIARMKADRVKTVAFFLCLLMPALPNLFFVIDTRRSYSGVVVVLLMSGLGLDYLLGCLKLHGKNAGAVLSGCIVLLVAAAGVWSTFAILNHPLEQRNAAAAHIHFVQSGTYLKQYAGADARNLALFSTAPNYLVAYYAEADYVDISRPLTAGQLFKEMEAKERSFLFVDEAVVRKYNRQFLPLLAPGTREFGDSPFAERLKPVYADYQTRAFIYEYRR